MLVLDISSYWMTLRKREDPRSTRSCSVENSLWKRLWTCYKTGLQSE